MIAGNFDTYGRPLLECRVIIPRLQVNGRTPFLLDTGADSTCLHQIDAERLRIPFDQLSNRSYSRGVGGRSTYFRESAFLSFGDGSLSRVYAVHLLIAEPNENNVGLPSLLGRNIINHWYMQYDPANAMLDCTVRHADYTLPSA